MLIPDNTLNQDSRVPNIGGAQGKFAHCKPLFFTIDIGRGTFPCATPVTTTLFSSTTKSQKRPVQMIMTNKNHFQSCILYCT